MEAFVVIKSEYDYESPDSERLVSCATFSSHEKAASYISDMLKRYLDNMTEELIDFEHDTYAAYDEDNIEEVRFTIIETEIDEFIR